MSKIVELTYSMGRTIQLKQYEPLNFHASAKCELEEGDSIDKEYDELRSVVRKQIAMDMGRVEDKRSRTTEARVLKDEGKDANKSKANESPQDWAF